MADWSYGAILKGVLGNRCAVCRKGAVFSGVYAMNDRCPECGTVFAKEPGYFLGAAVVAYFLGTFSLVPTLVLSFFVWQLELPAILTIGIAQILILHPVLNRLSKLGWIYVENRMTALLDNRSK